jgi:hypothetical protein
MISESPSKNKLLILPKITNNKFYLGSIESKKELDKKERLMKMRDFNISHKSRNLKLPSCNTQANKSIDLS